MIRVFVNIIAFVTLISCSNSSDFETGEIKVIKILREAVIAQHTSTMLLDTRKIVTRKKIDAAKVPVLFVELENGQNGTLTLYPGKGIGETWLGADGATITLENGIIKATRGMRRDVMGSKSSIPSWSQIADTSEYFRQISYLGGNNQTYSKRFACVMKKHIKQTTVIIFEMPFDVQKYVETCISNTKKFKNIYFVDYKNVVRRSKQYHGPALGYLMIERLEQQNMLQ